MVMTNLGNSTAVHFYPQMIGVKICYATPGGTLANADNDLMLQQL
jgi:hypothetical protein